MKYFTAKRLSALQSADATAVAAALADWEATAARYSRKLETIRQQLTDGAVELAEQNSLHDAQVLNLSYQDRDKLSLILRQQEQLHVLTFVLAAAPALTQPERPPAFASAGLLWLYEELELDDGTTILGVLLSDGSELTIPFASVSLQSFDVHPRPDGHSQPKRQGKSSRASRTKSADKSHPAAPPTDSVLDRLTPVIPPLTRRAADVKFPIVIRTRRAARSNGSTHR